MHLTRSVAKKRVVTPPFTLIAMLIAVSLVAGSGAAPGDEPRAGLVAAYSFDAGTGAPSPTLRKGKHRIDLGRDLDDGRQDRRRSLVRRRNDLCRSRLGLARPDTGMTLEAWVRPTALEKKWRTVVDKENGRWHRLQPVCQRAHRPPVGQVNIGGEQNATGAALAVNTWTHLATTFDGATLRSSYKRRPRRLARGERRDPGLDRAATHRRQLGLVRVVRGPDRRRPGLQPRSQRRGAPDGHEHACGGR